MPKSPRNNDTKMEMPSSSSTCSWPRSKHRTARYRYGMALITVYAMRSGMGKKSVEMPFPKSMRNSFFLISAVDSPALCGQA